MGEIELFDELEAAHRQGGQQAALALLIERLRTQKRYHELFDARLMECRLRLGLPAVLSGGLDSLDEARRVAVEDSYLDACREVGELLLAEGRIREAWLYLRPTADKSAMVNALDAMTPTDEQIESFIEVAVHEGVHPARGVRLVLERYGTCSAISTVEGGLHSWSQADRQAVIGALVRHVWEELAASLKRDIERHEGKPPIENSIAHSIEGRDWLFEQDSYHLDTSHLAATVRLARLVVDPEVLRLALELTEYGRRLSSVYQYPGEEPFRELYPSHGLFFSAQLGQRVDEALRYFEDAAGRLPFSDNGSGPAEVYIALLTRLSRHDEALEASARLIPPGVSTSGFAPPLMELAKSAGNYQRLREISRLRDDVLGFAAGLLAEETKSGDPIQ